MNFFIYIINFYFILLSVVTCSDDDRNVSVYTSTQVEVTQIHPQNDNSGINDFCSPFCSCQCCQLNITENPKLIYQIIIATYPIVKQTLWNIPLPSSYNKNIWQPPKLNA